jgi:hypothetical protein
MPMAGKTVILVTLIFFNAHWLGVIHQVGVQHPNNQKGPFAIQLKSGKNIVLESVHSRQFSCHRALRLICRKRGALLLDTVVENYIRRSWTELLRQVEVKYEGCLRRVLPRPFYYIQLFRATLF